MTEELISFPAAKLAREFGFNWKVWDYFDERGMEGKTIFNERCDFNYEGESTDWLEYSRPTQALLAKWLRDEFKIYVEVYWDIASIAHTSPNKWGVLVHHLRKFMVNDGKRHYTYEQAYEHGLLKALEYLANEKKSSGH